MRGTAAARRSRKARAAHNRPPQARDANTRTGPKNQRAILPRRLRACWPQETKQIKKKATATRSRGEKSRCRGPDPGPAGESRLFWPLYPNGTVGLACCPADRNRGAKNHPEPDRGPARAARNGAQNGRRQTSEHRSGRAPR
ncbi:hypothetical protein LSM04_001716 [Trypanosoma melophagium]|uniref:uncharacterized protein n=1 Tax=Trypanosoma melophagium TaxID=715481 RepID=UPI00351A5E48|nr:hypothetical protein LSM04_001716 [Trypanosoma melophagium]